MNNFPLPNNFTPRLWQEEFFEAFYRKCIAEGNPNFMLEACPGAGKTPVSGAIAFALLTLGLVKWIIIVVPTDHLRNQFARDCYQFFDLDLYHGTGHFATSDYQGEVITYSQLAANPGFYAKRCLLFGGKVLNIGDEIHHVGDLNTWGEAYREAFACVKYRLFTSGTPFRSDTQEILGGWIAYTVDRDQNKRSVSDYRYGYDRGVSDDVVRHVIFPAYEGDFSWIRNGQLHNKTFAEARNEQEENDALKTALMSEGGWIKETLEQAHRKLMDIRMDEHIDAAGVLICRDKNHAEECARVLESITGEKPLVVTSDDKLSSSKITEFATASGSNTPAWIVSIKMVSEGVDIKRLRVAVYATNILTEMFFRQVMGRIIRVIGGYEDETAYFYVPAHSTLLKYVEEIKEERIHLIEASYLTKNKTLVNNDDNGEGAKPGNCQPLSLTIPVSSTGYEKEQFFDGLKLSPDEIEKAGIWKKQLKLREPEAKIAALLKLHEAGNKPTPSIANYDSSYQQSFETKTERIKKLKSKIKSRAFYLSRLRQIEPKSIHQEWKEMGNKWSSQCPDELELSRKLNWIEEQILISRG
jgi:superfamily II DNA or RNA helicase